MDTHYIIEGLFALCGFFGGYTVNSMARSVEKIEDKLDRFVIKEDYKDDLHDIKDMLNKIFEKLDNKVDK